MMETYCLIFFTFFAFFSKILPFFTKRWKCLLLFDFLPSVSPEFFKEFRSASLVYSLSCTVLSFSFQWIWWTVFTLTFFVYLTCIIKQFYIKHEMNQDNYNYFCSVENIHFLLLLTNMADFYKSHKRYRLPERNAWYG